MRIVFYTRPGYLAEAFSLLGPISKQAEVHLIVEISPEEQGKGSFPVITSLPNGLWPVKNVDGWPPPSVQCRLKNLASFHLAVYTARRAFYPGNLFTSWQTARFIRSIRPQILHFDEASSRAAALPYLLPHIPLVLSIHDSQPHIGEAGGRFELVRKLFLRKVRTLIFHSQYSLRTFLALPVLQARRVQTCVIPLGVCDVFRDVCDLMDETVEDRPDPRTVLFFGRISPYKGVETLLAAAPLVARQISGFRLIVAGAPISGYQLPEPPQLENRGVCEYLLRTVNVREIRALFSAAALVALPYLEATQSGVVSTAFAFHKPVVATAVGGLPEMVEDGVTGRLVPPRNQQALADAIIELLLDDPKRRKMTIAIQRKEREALAWPRLVGMTLEAYQQALGQKKS